MRLLLDFVHVTLLASSVALAALLVSVAIYRALHASWPRRALVLFFVKLYIAIADADVFLFLVFHRHAKH